MAVLFCSVAASAQNASLPPVRYIAQATVVDPDAGKMGTYRTLAQLAFEASIENHAAQAGVLARILEKVWDRGEGDLRKSSPEVWSKIDKSMDGFVKPLISEGASANGKVSSALLSKLYQQYLSDLATAD